MRCSQQSTPPSHLASLQGRLVNEFKIFFGISPAVAEIMAGTADKIYTEESDLTTPGTMLYSAVSVNEPAGKPLQMCMRSSVKLTIWKSSDDKIKDIKVRKKLVLKRITTEAYDQDGVLTIEDCERILMTSVRTIKDYLSEFKSEGIYLPLRGYIHSTGRGQTHKNEIICFYLEDMGFEEIKRRTCHSLEAIGRYISTFSRIVVCHVKQKMKLEDIATVVKINPEVVRQYLQIYHKYSGKNNERLNIILNPKEFDYYIGSLKKKGPVK